MTNNQKAALVLATLFLAIVSMFGWALTSISQNSIQSQKTVILNRANMAVSKPLSEQEKIAIFQFIGGGQVNQYHFSESEMKLLMQSLNK